MKEISYRYFSWKTHQAACQSRPFNSCQFELTFKCGLHCRHCYADCFNKPAYISKELDTFQAKAILDKIHGAGVLWLCLTGGDPLSREDFPDIYAYARKKGFIITLFTSGYCLTEEIARFLKKRPPFSIEMTLNAVKKESYENISGVKASFGKVSRAIRLILSKGLPLKIKTQVTADNLKELPQIKKFLGCLGLSFNPSIILYPRLNGDTAPCNLRVPVEAAVNLFNRQAENKDSPPRNRQAANKRNPLFSCVVNSSDGFRVDPYGNIFLCELIRRPKISLFKTDIESAIRKIRVVLSRDFRSSSACRSCNFSERCLRCPGRAYLENNDMEAPIEYYCALAKYAGR